MICSTNISYTEFTIFHSRYREGPNIDQLTLRFYLQTPALVVEKDAVFIPAGWDNDKKIAILYENMHR